MFCKRCPAQRPIKLLRAKSMKLPTKLVPNIAGSAISKSSATGPTEQIESQTDRKRSGIIESTILLPSNGGIGMRLNTASPTLTENSTNNNEWTASH